MGRGSNPAFPSQLVGLVAAHQVDDRDGEQGGVEAEDQEDGEVEEVLRCQEWQEAAVDPDIRYDRAHLSKHQGYFYYKVEDQNGSNVFKPIPTA